MATSLAPSARQTIWDNFCSTLAKDPSPIIRAKSAIVMGKLYDPKFIPNLKDALADKSPIVRQAVIQSLGQICLTCKICTKEITQLIIDALIDTDSEVSAAVAIVLDQLQAESAIETLLLNLTASAVEVRSSAAQALGQIGSPKAVFPLLTALEKAIDPKEINLLIEVLTAINQNDSSSSSLIQSTAKKLINHSTSSELRQKAIILLDRTGADPVCDLIPLLKNSDIYVVQTVLELLGNATLIGD
jgi:HEAT repeat protein